MRVLYLHGFEETPSSPKPVALAADRRIELHVPLLHIYMYRRHSPLRYLIMQAVPLAALLGLASCAALGRNTQAACSALSLCLLGGLLFGKRLLAAAIGRSYDASYAIACDALRSFKPDVVVGFSWGGSLVCRMLAEGLWNGPTLLLAPGHTLIHTRMRRAVGAVPLPACVKVMHSNADQIVPIEHSLALCRAAGVSLDVVDGEAHRMYGICAALPGIVFDLGNSVRQHT